MKMSPSTPDVPALPAAGELPVAYYWRAVCGALHEEQEQTQTLRSRSVSATVLTGRVDIPAPPARLTTDWERQIAEQLGLAPGDVEPLPLPRARLRWPDYRRCVQAAAAWTRSLGLQEVLDTADVALMACRGARYHHDAAQYGGFAFCNLFLSEDKGLDLHFAATGQRIALTRGTLVVFDTGLPHAVIRRGSSVFDEVDFPCGQDCSLVFLSWELPIENADIARELHIAFDVDPSAPPLVDDAQLRLHGAPVEVCPQSGQWQLAQET